MQLSMCRCLMPSEMSYGPLPDLKAELQKGEVRPVSDQPDLRSPTVSLSTTERAVAIHVGKSVQFFRRIFYLLKLWTERKATLRDLILKITYK